MSGREPKPKIGISTDDLAKLNRYVLLIEAKLDKLNAEAGIRFASIRNPAEHLPAVEAFILSRYDLQVNHFSYVATLAVSKGATAAIVPFIEALLAQIKAQELDNLSSILRRLRPEIKVDIENRVALLLSSRMQSTVADLKLEIFHQLPLPVTARNPPVTLAMRKRRSALVKKYRDQHGLKMGDLARKIAMDPSAIRGIINEARKRFSEFSQIKLLSVLGVTNEEWYQ